jgi:hypothetical protein
MLKGDACWSTRKRLLGWNVDTATETLHLPPHRLARLYELLDHLQPPRKRTSIKTWHRLLGELRSMTIALPGTKGLFPSFKTHSARPIGIGCACCLQSITCWRIFVR